MRPFALQLGKNRRAEAAGLVGVVGSNVAVAAKQEAHDAIIAVHVFHERPCRTGIVGADSEIVAHARWMASIVEYDACRFAGIVIEAQHRQRMINESIGARAVDHFAVPLAAAVDGKAVLPGADAANYCSETPALPLPRHPRACSLAHPGSQGRESAGRRSILRWVCRRETARSRPAVPPPSLSYWGRYARVWHPA